MNSTNLKIMTFKQLIEDSSEPPDPIVDNGVLLERTLLMIFGKDKSRKSFLVFNMAIAIAQGKDFACFRVKGQHKVMVLSAEGGYFPNRDRVKVMTASDTDVEAMENIYYCNSAFLDLNDDTHLDMLKDDIEEIEPDVLIIDPLIRFHSGDENSSKEMSTIFTRLRGLIEQNKLSIILVHHTGKDQGRGARGSSVINSEYDSAIYVQQYRDADNHTFSFYMRHVETPEPVNLRFNPETFWFEEQGNGDPVALTLKDAGPINRKELVERVRSIKGCGEQHAYRLIKDAQKRGVIRRSNGTLELVKD